MDNYLVSARKYRPTSFETVIGQDFITQTLQRAIDNNQLAQAFLFCGPRGVGKTTCARILAKAINSEGLSEEEIENADYSFNIFELDAASNNSVEDIRSIIDQVRIPPQTGKYKVFIIDEVHMLSQAAFNAFLKTLEEPPAHAIFILATTEKQKIIPTILSRCQIFDFNRLQIKDIVKQLNIIAERESVKVDSDAVHLIAQKADGAMRDALSIFDQMRGLGDGEISYALVIEQLKILDYENYFSIVEALEKGDTTKCLSLFDQLLNQGFDGLHFILGLGNHMRNLLVGNSPETVHLLNVGEKAEQRYLEQAQQIEANWLLNGLDIISACDVAYKTHPNPRLLVELALIKLATLSQKSGAIAKKKTTNPVELTEKAPGSKKEAQLKSPPAAEKNEEKPALKPKAEERPPATDLQAHTTAAKTPRKKILSTGISIRETLSTKQNTQKDSSPKTTKAGTSSIENKKNNPFTKEEFFETWNKYAKIVKERNQDSLFSTLTKRKPIVSDRGKITLEIDNKVEEEYLGKKKAELLEYLRSELKNSNIQLDTFIKKQDDRVFLYTSVEKYKAMTEKNPNLAKLRKALDLDIDF